MDKDGNYVYSTWVQQPDGLWELKPVCTARIGEDDARAGIAIVLDDMDCGDDRANSMIRRICGKVFEEQRAAFEAGPADENGGKRIGPWGSPGGRGSPPPGRQCRSRNTKSTEAGIYERVEGFPE